MLDKVEDTGKHTPKRKRRVIGMRRRWIMGLSLIHI